MQAGLAQAEGDGVSAGQSALLARTLAHAYATQTVQQDVAQIQPGNGQRPGYGTSMNLSTGNYCRDGQ